jgi:hypothetical protein
MAISLKQLREGMKHYGARKFYFKKLSSNDNSKNQIYLGADYSALNILPFGEVYTDSQALAQSKKARYKAPLDVSWFTEEGLFKAPHAQLILYPRYPEVRMSGFLRGCQRAPTDVLAVRDEGRVLFLGIATEGKIIAFAAKPEHPVVKELITLPAFRREELLIELPLVEGVSDDGRSELISELTRIHKIGWIPSYRLNSGGSSIPCLASNCGGYTLEAELGITPNGYAEPDFCGWELKQHNVRNLLNPKSGGPITLMTPEPTAGYYKTEGVQAFIRKFGYKDKLGRPDRLNFGGLHRFGEKQQTTGLTLELTGYNLQTGKIENTAGGVSLVSEEGETAATWMYSDLMSHWNKKHARASYVPSQCKTDPQRQYKFGPVIRLGIGTDFDQFLRAIQVGSIYYDPGIKMENASSSKPCIKRRSQFRVKSKDIPTLYKAMEQIDLSQT